jgi:hypothetical protein
MEEVVGSIPTRSTKILQLKPRTSTQVNSYNRIAGTATSL